MAWTSDWAPGGKAVPTQGAQVHAMDLTQDPPLPRPHLRAGSGDKDVLMEIPVYLRPSKGKQLLSFVSVPTAVAFEHIFACCSLRLCSSATTAALSITLQHCFYIMETRTAYSTQCEAVPAPAYLDPSGDTTASPSWASSANLVRMHSIPTSRSLVEVLSRAGPRTGLWGALLVPSQQQMQPHSLQPWGLGKGSALEGNGHRTACPWQWAQHQAGWSWKMVLDIWFNFSMVLCRARVWTQWSLQNPSKWGRSTIISHAIDLVKFQKWCSQMWRQQS